MSSSYKDIIKSTSIIGGSKIMTIIIGIVRSKIVAVFLGSAGVGIIALFNSALVLIRNLSQLGLNLSSVKDIAEAVGSGDDERVARTTKTLRFWVWITGILGMLMVSALSAPLSKWTFGGLDYQWDFILLSATMLLSAINGGQLAILRGHRMINQIAKANIWAAVFSVALTAPIYYFIGVKGIVAVLVLTAASNVLISYFYTRNISLVSIEMSIKEKLSYGKGMVKLGSLTVLSGLLTNATAYYLRLYINDEMGVATVGLFSVASTLSVYYLDIVLSTLGTDYFPRISEVSNDHDKLNKLVNEQTLVTILLGVPLIAGMLLMAKPLILLFYSSDFLNAQVLLQWLLLGVGLRLISWPLSYVLLSKSKGFKFVIVEGIWNATYIGSSMWLMPRIGLEGIGVSFVIAYLLYYVIYLVMTRNTIEFKYEARAIMNILLLATLLSVIFVLMYKGTGIFIVLAVAAFIALMTIALFQFNRILPLKEVVNKVTSRFKK